MTTVNGEIIQRLTKFTVSGPFFAKLHASKITTVHSPLYKWIVRNFDQFIYTGV